METKININAIPDSIPRSDLFKTINGESILGSGDMEIKVNVGSSQSMIPITYSELKTLRDNENLVAGSWYRITDYVTTTSQEGTLSAGHPFDIAVFATSSKTLSEEARAIRHRGEVVPTILLLGYVFKFNEVIEVDGVLWFEFVNDVIQASLVTDTATPKVGDTAYFYSEGSISPDEVYTIEQVGDLEYEYFLSFNANLDSWKIWYCLDNDTLRFTWAIKKSNKKISVEFSGILLTLEYVGLRTYESTMYHQWDTIYDGLTLSVLTDSDNPTIGSNISGAVGGGMYLPIVLPITAVYEASNNEGYGVIYRMIDERGNDCPYDFKNIQFLVPMSEGQFDLESTTQQYAFTFNMHSTLSEIDMSIVTASKCFNNVIKSRSTGLIPNVFLNLALDSLCYNNTLVNDCTFNIFNADCYNNTLGNGCSGNIFESNSYNLNVAPNVSGLYISRDTQSLTSELRVAYDSYNRLKIYCAADNYNSVLTVTDSAVELIPNVYYVWTNTPSSLYITLSASYDTNMVNNYMFEFTTSGTGTTVSLPSTIKWANGETPTFEANTTYQISIVNNLGVVQKFK